MTDPIDSNKRLIIAPLYDFDVEDYGETKFPAQVNLEGGYKIKAINYNHLVEGVQSFKHYLSDFDLDELRNCTHAIYFSYESENDKPEIPLKIDSDISLILQTLRLVSPTKATRAIFHLKVKGSAINTMQIKHRGSTYTAYPKHAGVSFKEFGFLNRPDEIFEKSDAVLIQKYWKQIYTLIGQHQGQYNRIMNAMFFMSLGFQH